VLYGISYGKVLCGECYTAYRTVRYCVGVLYGISYAKVLCRGVIRHIVR